MVKTYLIAYVSTEEENIKNILSKHGIFSGKTPHAHALYFTTSMPKSEIDSVPGVLYVEEEK